MQQQLAATTPTIDPHTPDAALASENAILSELEALLDRPFVTEGASCAPAATAVRRPLAPIFLIAGIGAALALAPLAFKDALTTGRSVAHSTNR